MKNYNQAPLPFQGQKRRFLGQFKECLTSFRDEAIFVDLFGGSGLIAHTIKQQRPDARVIYNDYDWYINRLNNIGRTNELLSKIRTEIQNFTGGGILKKERLPKELREKILRLIYNEEQEYRYVDYITLSASLLFSGQFATSYEELAKEYFYNKVKQSEYNTEGYLEGVEITHSDYKMLFSLYKHIPNICFVLDPPYLSTDCCSYTSYWRLKDYLDVLDLLQGTSYIYFTSNKTSIVELCQWLAMHPNFENPFEKAERKEVNVGINHAAGYRDMMMWREI